MSDTTYLVEGNFKIKTANGSILYSEALADTSTEVWTQRGLVPIRSLLPEDVVVLEVAAGSMPGIIIRHG